MSKPQKINRVALSISLFGVFLIFLGMLFSAGLSQTAFRFTGSYLLSIGAGILILYYLGTFFYFLFHKNSNAIQNLATFDVGLCFLFIISGLTAALLKIDLGMTVFLTGLGMFGAFWIFVLIYMIFNHKNV